MDVVALVGCLEADEVKVGPLPWEVDRLCPHPSVMGDFAVVAHSGRMALSSSCDCRLGLICSIDLLAKGQFRSSFNQ